MVRFRFTLVCGSNEFAVGDSNERIGDFNPNFRGCQLSGVIEAGEVGGAVLRLTLRPDLPRPVGVGGERRGGQQGGEQGGGEETSAAAALSYRTGFATATDLADSLVRRGLPFRDAHEVVGRAVREGVASGRDLAEFSLDELRAFSPLIEADVFAVLTLEGGTVAAAGDADTGAERVAEILRGNPNIRRVNQDWGERLKKLRWSFLG